MTEQKNKTLMRNLGEFVGHIVKGIRTRPGEPRRTIVRKEVEEENHGDVVLRRTTIEEIEMKQRTDTEAGTESDTRHQVPDQT